MKFRALPFASAVFLIGSLLFVQVGVNFFHKNHDVHQLKSVTAPLKDGAAGVQKHDEHCQVCSIDFFNNAFVTTSSLFFDEVLFPSPEEHFVVSIELISLSFSKGRSPPATV
ncbi:MAG: hypothetical protein JSS79_15665 [Bacteroidetes bacterium]|nr:hypothetical protein [Bacteroidota bacterium]